MCHLKEYAKGRMRLVKRERGKGSRGEGKSPYTITLQREFACQKMHALLCNGILRCLAVPPDHMRSIRSKQTHLFYY